MRAPDLRIPLRNEGVVRFAADTLLLGSQISPLQTSYIGFVCMCAAPLRSKQRGARLQDDAHHCRAPTLRVTETLKFISEKWVVIISQPPNSRKKPKTSSLSLFSYRNFIHQMALLRGNLMSHRNLFQQTSTSVRSVLISYYRILSTRRVINNSCHSLFVVCPWTAQSWEADSCVRTRHPRSDMTSS